MKVLVVEDDPGISEVLDYALRADGHQVTTTQRGRGAATLAEGMECVLLDIGLPDLDGFEVCRQIRKTSDVPILFLTSRSDEIDRVVGLELGADDYIAKPFSVRELLARIKAVRRRLDRRPEHILGLAMDTDRHAATWHGQPIELSRTEFDLLHVLHGQPGRVFTREQLLDRAWPDGGCVTDRTVDAHIKALRKKLPDPSIIETVRGIGYRVRQATP